MDTLPVCEAPISTNGPSKAPRGRPRKVVGVHAPESSEPEAEASISLDLQSLPAMGTVGTQNKRFIFNDMASVDHGSADNGYTYTITNKTSEGITLKLPEQHHFKSKTIPVLGVRFKTSIKLPASGGETDTFWLNAHSESKYKLAYHVSEQFVSIERAGQCMLVPISNVQYIQTK